MKTLHARTLALLTALVAANATFAAGPGGAGAAGANAHAGGAAGVGATLPGSANMNAGANVGAGVGTANKPADVPSPNANAIENSNGQFIEERKFGQDRAAERRSAQGAAHEKATGTLDSKASANAKPPRKPSTTGESSTK